MPAGRICESAIRDAGQFARFGEAHEGSFMMRATAVALAILGSCDFVAFGGRYTTTMLQILAAIEHSLI